MKRGEPCAHLRPDYDRMEMAHYIQRDPDTGEISWEPTSVEEELRRLGLIAYQPCTKRIPSSKEEDADT